MSSGYKYLYHMLHGIVYPKGYMVIYICVGFALSFLI